MGAAVTLLLSASALGAGVLTTEQVAIGGAGAQQNPAIAIDPDAPLNAAVVAEDLSGGGLFPRTVTASSLDWSGAAWPAATLPHPGQSPSAGQPDLAWGVDGSGSGSGPGPGSEVVYLVEEASTSNSICTPGNDGVFFSSSDDGGAHWDTSLPVTTGASRTESIEPAIAADRNTPGRVYIAYSRLTFADANCTGSPLDSEIYLIYSTNGGGSWFQPRRVSPISPSGTDHYRDPSLAVLPDGRVIVAFRNEPSEQVETETCTFLPAPPATNYCGAPTSGLVGASTVVGNVGGSGLPAPSVVAAGGRVTVAWSAPSGDAVRAFAAMSMDGGASFGPAAADRSRPRRQPVQSAAGRDRRRARRRRLPVGSRGHRRRERDDGLGSGPAAGRDDPGRGLGQSGDGSGHRHLDGTRHRPPRHRDGQRDQPAAGDRRGLHGHVIGKPRRARGRPAPRHDRAGHRQLAGITGVQEHHHDPAHQGHRRRRRSAHVVGRRPACATPARA